MEGNPYLFLEGVMLSCYAVQAHAGYVYLRGEFWELAKKLDACFSELEKAGFLYMDYDEAISKYNPKILLNGFNTLKDGEVVFFISNPALGLWACKDKFTD